jgi:hypothetical protein
MVVNVAAQAVAKAGTTGVKVAGKTAATTARTGTRAAAAAGRAGARAGSRAGGAAARSAARGGSGAARSGTRAAGGPGRVAQGLRDVRPGGPRRPPSMPRRVRSGGGPQDEENPDEGGGNRSTRRSRRGRRGDPVTPVTGALRTAARVLNHVSRPIKGRRRRRRIRRLLDVTERDEARRRRTRRNRRLLRAMAGIVALLMSCTTVVGVGTEGNAEPPPTEGQLPGGSAGTGSSEAPFGPLGSTARYTQGRRMTDKTQRFVDRVVPIFGQGRDMHCWRPGTEGEHPKGRACDFVMQLPLNQMPTPQYLEHGWALVNYCIEHADELQVRYVIWQKRIWQRGIGWRDYTRYDPDGNLQQNHYDHVHVTIEE